MRSVQGVILLGMLAFAAPGMLRAAASMPDWAYAIPPAPPAGGPPNPRRAPDTSPKQVPGSDLTFTRPQISDGFGPADWFPGDHPTMPEIVAHGRRPEVRACGLCHYPNGKGRQENAGVSGLPVSYFIQTMNDFRRPAQERRATKEQHQPHDRDRQGDDARGDQRDGRILRRDEMDAVGSRR